MKLKLKIVYFIYYKIRNFSEPYEIIVVDNFSEDKTANVCKEYDVKFFSKNENQHKKFYGILKSCYEIIIFLDSDMEVSKDLLNLS